MKCKYSANVLWIETGKWRRLLTIIAIGCSFLRARADEGTQHTLLDVLRALAQNGQVLVDLEQGPLAPQFGRIDLAGRKEYLDTLQGILASQGLGWEMRGPVMIIFDKKQRASGVDYPLNRKIPYIKLSKVSVGDCLAEIGKQLNVTLYGGGPTIAFTNQENVTFDIELKDISLRDALFVIVAHTPYKTWNASTLPEGSVSISFQ